MEVMNNLVGRAGYIVDSVMSSNTWWALSVAKVTGCHSIVEDEASKSHQPSLTVIAEEHQEGSAAISPLAVSSGCQRESDQSQYVAFKA